MTSATPAQLSAGLAVAHGLVAAVRSEQWTMPTPCTEWDVRALVSHVVSGNHLFADVLAGRTTLEEFRRIPSGDVLGDQPVRAFDDSAQAVVAAFELPGVLEHPVSVPFGTVPGTTALHLRITEILVHGWDLARAIGQPAGFDDAVVEQELQFSRQALTQLPTGRAPFAAPAQASGTAPAIDRLAALLGREVVTTS
ncbi:MAG TPA: TIGR03086 family metal-binding protein [Kineosporiaceae bacterium]